MYILRPLRIYTFIYLPLHLYHARHQEKLHSTQSEAKKAFSKLYTEWCSNPLMVSQRVRIREKRAIKYEASMISVCAEFARQTFFSSSCCTYFECQKSLLEAKEGVSNDVESEKGEGRERKAAVLYIGVKVTHGNKGGCKKNVREKKNQAEERKKKKKE